MVSIDVLLFSKELESVVYFYVMFIKFFLNFSGFTQHKPFIVKYFQSHNKISLKITSPQQQLNQKSSNNCRTELQIIFSYFTKRKPFVDYNTTFFCLIILANGMPQRYNLDPLLFQYTSMISQSTIAQF